MILYVLVALLGLISVYGIYDSLVAGGRSRGLYWPLGFAAYFAAIYYLLIPWMTRRIYKQTKALKDPFTVELTEQEMRLVSPRGSTCMKYVDFHKWKMNERAILLYHSDAVCHVLPARVFSSQAERAAFVEMLEQQLGKQRA